MNTSVLPVSQGSEASLGEDLPTLACNAAIELDNLLLQRTERLPAVRRLSERLTEEVPELIDLASPLSLVDPSTVVALHGTLQESQISSPSDQLSDLTRQAGEIVRRLKATSEDPRTARARDEGGLRQLREFCLIFSRRAAATSRDPEESRPQHPFRRQG